MKSKRTTIEDEILGVKSEIKDLKARLIIKADIDRLALLEARVQKLEERQLILREEKKKYKAWE